MEETLIEVPEDAQGFIVDNSLEYLIFKIPNYKNWVTDDILASPKKLDKYLETTPTGEDWKTSGKRLHGKYSFVETRKVDGKTFAVLTSFTTSGKQKK